MKKKTPGEKNNVVFCILCQAKIKAVKVSTSEAKLAEKDSKCKEKEDAKKRKSIDKPLSAKKSCTTKASAHIIRELRRLGCQLLSNYSVITVITVFWTSNVGYCLFFRRVIMKFGERNQKVKPK
jgi:hypothetical protein